jgi:5-methylcytosine-specific restriction protein A
MEPHHLIPLQFQNQFAHSLDIEENIVSLCSNCHNQLHYGKGSNRILQKLFNERIGYLRKAGIVITFEELLDLYD